MVRIWIAALCLYSVPASAAHMHCDTQPWTVTTPLTGTTPGGNFFVDFGVPAPPASSVGGCSYEISDLTFVQMSLTVTFSPSITSNIWIGFPAINPNPDFPTTGNLLFNVTQFGGSGTGTWIQALTPHDPGPGQLEFSAPQTIRVLWETSSVSLINGSAIASGTHYYVVPEPTTVMLTFAPLLLAVARAFKRSANQKR